MLTTHHKKAKKGRNVRATAIALGARTNIYLRAEHYWSPHGPLLIAVATNSGARPDQYCYTPPSTCGQASEPQAATQRSPRSRKSNAYVAATSSLMKGDYSSVSPHTHPPDRSLTRGERNVGKWLAFANFVACKRSEPTAWVRLRRRHPASRVGDDQHQIAQGGGRALLSPPFFRRDALS